MYHNDDISRLTFPFLLGLGKPDHAWFGWISLGAFLFASTVQGSEDSHHFSIVYH
jgi:hypothetical protein